MRKVLGGIEMAIISVISKMESRRIKAVAILLHSNTHFNMTMILFISLIAIHILILI
jgi:hypothetical protein